MQIKISFFGPVWEIDHAQNIFKFFEFFKLKSKTRINFRNSSKTSKKNTKNCHEDKKLKVARALCASPPPSGWIGLKIKKKKNEYADLITEIRNEYAQLQKENDHLRVELQKY